MGPTTQLNQHCNENLLDLTSCSSCLAAGMKVTSQLVSLDKNSTKCFYFTVLYAAGIVNDLGPERLPTASCILGLPLSSSTSMKKNDTPNRARFFKFVFGFTGAVIVILVLLGSVMAYRFWVKRKKHKEAHIMFVTNVRATLKPNTGAIWFQVRELEQATEGFSQRNLIGQGGNGVVYKGILMDRTNIAVKMLLDLDSKGDEEFANEVEVIEDVFDASLRDVGPRGIMDRFVRVGILCAHVMVAFRPTVAEALKMLEGDIDIPRLPDRPLPLSHESFRLSSLQYSSSLSSISRYELD
ncbi:hypothetical protein GIB67_031970 [Kingdonia uniflora]|uniref:Uncharacterized protein n=1 Tax=Kingdonia uniflora TaxID=39325 RepID=A0A7J7NUB0_9MAGN|nr:hypothetical protein GIB67_031970 [Kingdonia uniflora]